MPNSMTTQKENPCVKCKGEDETQQVYLCKKCKDLLNSHTCSGGCSNCADIEFEKIYGPTRGPQKEGLRIGMLNANSMLRNMDLITGLVHSHQFDIFVVVETKLTEKKDKDLDEVVAINDYNKIRFDRPVDNPKKAGGGIIIYYRSWFKIPKWKRNVYKENKIQYMRFDVTHPWKFKLFAIYNPNEKYKQSALEYMEMAYKDRRDDKIVMLGDLNVEPMKEIEDLGAKQIIGHPTRVMSKTATSIDHIYTNIQIEEGSGGGGGGPGPGGGRGGEEASSSRIVESGVIRSAISDHDVVFCTVKLPEDITLPSKCFAPDRYIIDLFDGTSSNASITELMQQIREKTKNMGPIHNSYSTPSTPSDIMTEGIREIERRKIEAMKSSIYELKKWRDISKAKKSYQPPKASKKSPPEASRKSFIKDFAECSEFLTSSSILSWNRNTSEEVTREEVKTAIEWVIKSRANKVGRFHEVEELVKERTSGPVLNALIKGYKIFFGPNSPTQSERGQSSTKSLSTVSARSSTKVSTDEEEGEESNTESIIYGVFDYLIAARTVDEVDIVKSRGDTLKEFHTFLKKETNHNGFVFAYFVKCSHTNFEPILGPSVEKIKFDEYWSKRNRRVEIKESPLFQRYLAVKRAEFEVPEDCKMFASADEIAFCMTFGGGLKKTRLKKEKEEMEKKLNLMKEFKEQVLSVSVYNVDIVSRLITKAKAGAKVDKLTENLNYIKEICGTVDRETVVTFCGVKINPTSIKSLENKETLEKLRRLKKANKSFARKESSMIECVTLFTYGKVKQ